MINKVRPRITLGAGRNLNERLARAIGERILGSEFAPGALLPNEADWGKTYGASRTAVREAIKTLNGKGLLRSRPKVGSRVEPRMRWNLLDRDVLDWHHAAMDRLAFVQSTQEARRLLEPGIAMLAARKHSPQQVKRLVDATHAMKTARNAGEFNVADVEFHEALLACANNDLLLPFGIVIEKALTTLFEFTTMRNPQLPHAVRLHEQIARAVAGGQEKAAHAAMITLLDDTDSVIGSKTKPTRRPVT
jgi:DNA-binding FadR family transcriptional regulator